MECCTKQTHTGSYPHQRVFQCEPCPLLSKFSWQRPPPQSYTACTALRSHYAIASVSSSPWGNQVPVLLVRLTLPQCYSVKKRVWVEKAKKIYVALAKQARQNEGKARQKKAQRKNQNLHLGLTIQRGLSAWECPGLPAHQQPCRSETPSVPVTRNAPVSPRASPLLYYFHLLQRIWLRDMLYVAKQLLYDC